MTRQKTVIVVTALAIVFAVVAAGLMYNYLQKQEQLKAGTYQTIVVAAMQIPIGSKITDTMVKTAPWPKESVPPGSASDPKALTAAGRINIKSIPAGEPITEDKLAPVGGAAGAGFMTYVVPPGHRAVTVAVNEVAGVAGFITPGNKVDVVLTTPLPGNPNETISKIVLQNVPVLATGQIAQEQKDGKPIVVPTVTLDLTPEDAENLVLAANKGPLQLLLRNYSDSAEVAGRGSTIRKVLGGAQPTVQSQPAEKIVRVIQRAPVRKKAAPPADNYSVEVIKGKDRTTRQFTPAENGQ
ncbi:MAG: Flp pilus assembly protein CpaB [Deltaproteobacteria bacterium]|nr:Flp pilus assembly protein CpaB [Deltaproteobacteria bacterium]TLN00374.1 MAG: Flp pilus assembly protein CpaB [bacterium]